MSVLLLSIVVIYLFRFSSQYTEHCSNSEENDIRLYNTRTNVDGEGAVQYCHSRKWYSVCDNSWDCAEANVACRQLGYDKARSATNDSDDLFGSWSYMQSYYFPSCSGNENTLSDCNHLTYSYCDHNNNEAGVRCTNISTSPSCNVNGDLRLTGGSTNDEGVLEYCYYGDWSPFCNLDVEEAVVACKQLGYSKYADFLSFGKYAWDSPTESMFTSFSCSQYATETSLSQCDGGSVYTECAATCQYPKAIKCYRNNQCNDGEVRLVGGSIAQEGRVEVCVDGVWGSVCGNGWTKQTAFMVCKQAGFDSEPVIYTNSEYGIGKTPIVYYNIHCQGWEKTLSECTKTHYLHFTCSVTAGLLCPDNCPSGDIRLVGGETFSEGTLSEGTVEVCRNKLWGLITDTSWDKNDAEVVCRQLNLPFDGAQPIHNSHFGKPDIAIHYSFVSCNGGELSITSCKKSVHELKEGRQIYQEAIVAGVACKNATPTPEPICMPVPPNSANECRNGQLILKNASGLMELCINGTWTIICHLTHNETTVACRQLGYTNFIWGLPYGIEDFSSKSNFSLVSNISCFSTENKLSECAIKKQKCQCETALGLNCYKPGECSEGSIRLTDGTIEQEGRVEVCVNGVWGSVCDNGWDTTDAYVVCQQLGYSDLKPLPFKGSHFGPSSGPIFYSDVQCEGWEKHFEECRKKNHLEIQCSHRTVAGVMCLDGCSDGDVRLVGSEGSYQGTVEVCYDNLWGLIDDDGWGISDATVVCRQLGFQKAKNATTGSLFGKPNKVIHISEVNCDGSETSIDQCSSKRYTLKEGKKLIQNLDVVGAVCYVPISVSTQRITSSMISMIAIIVLVSLLLIMVVTMNVLYCIYKKRKNHHRHLPTVKMINSRGEDNNYSFNSSDEDSDGDVKQLIKTDTNIDKTKSSDKDKEIEICFKAGDEDEPIYEECNIKNE